MFLPLKGSLEIFFGHYSMIQISVRGPKTVPAQTAEVMSLSLFSLDFKPKVLLVMLFLW